MSSDYVPYSDVYSSRDYDRNDRRHDRRRVQEIPAEDISAVRAQQLDDFYRPASRRDDINSRSVNGRQSREYEDNNEQHYASRRRRPQRRESYSSRSSSNSDYEEPDRRQQVARRQGQQDGSARRAQSEKRQSRAYDGDLQNFASRTFDASPNGALAASVGAAIGAISVRRFGGNHFNPNESSQNWKTVAGAVVGGLAANAAEAQWQQHREKKQSEEGEGYNRQ
ncbi:uncharacterized protein LTR77_009405 [Saxophila tyrrhenica]|uniref:Glycine zipper 2TM domain-containing protein n=1 Tax=Saxophila tyrrhenica TaxID=1690608 RepID=A0AAV9P0B3_9PEZI|nr:hypothetical protein LTR77_009405 [Saxophila tyrrhenica]